MQRKRAHDNSSLALNPNPNNNIDINPPPPPFPTLIVTVPSQSPPNPPPPKPGNATNDDHKEPDSNILFSDKRPKTLHPNLNAPDNLCVPRDTTVDLRSPKPLLHRND